MMTCCPRHNEWHSPEDECPICVQESAESQTPQPEPRFVICPVHGTRYWWEDICPDCHRDYLQQERCPDMAVPLPDDALGEVYLVQRDEDDNIQLYSWTLPGTSPTEVGFILEVRGPSGGVADHGTDGWFPVIDWEGKPIGVFFLDGVLTPASSETLLKSIQNVLFPGKEVVFLAKEGCVK